MIAFEFNSLKFEHSGIERAFEFKCIRIRLVFNFDKFRVQNPQ